MRARSWSVLVLAAPLCAALACALALPAASSATEYEEPPTSFGPVLEAENFSITQQRQAIYDTPEYQAQLASQGLENQVEATRERSTARTCAKGAPEW